MLDFERKEFSQTLSDENDPQSRIAFIAFAESYLRWVCVGEADPLNPAARDLVFHTPTGKEVWVETERKLETNWNEHGRKNRFDTLHIPYRKKDSKSDIYAMFNHHYDTMALGSMQMAKKAPVKEVRCFVEGRYKDDLMYDCNHRGFRYYTKFNRNEWVEITMHGDLVTLNEPSTYVYANHTPFILGVDA